MKGFSRTEIINLLNANKNNLSALKDTNIIIEYFKLLGAKIQIYGTSSENDIIMPEIERLLKYYNYNCQFSESGIFVGAEKILGYDNDCNIYWKRGKNRTNFYASGFYVGNTVGYSKWITDFTDLLEVEKSSISNTALMQIQNPEDNSAMSLKEIIIFNTITSGIEVSKKVIEEYQNEKNPEDWVDIFQTMTYSPNDPTICYDRQCIASPHIQSDLNMYIEKYHINYTSNPSIDMGLDRVKLPNYGDSIMQSFMKADEKYDYNKLYTNLMRYHQIYPLEVHPIYIYIRKYSGFIRKYLLELEDDFNFHNKIHTSSARFESDLTLMKQYRLTHPYEINPRFFEIIEGGYMIDM